MKTITTIEALKDEFRKVKLQVGDLRGLKNRFELSERLGIAGLHTFYYSMGGNGKERSEVYADITPKGQKSSFWSYSMKEMLIDIENCCENEFEIQMCNARWNSERNEAKRSDIGFPFIYKKVID